MTDDQDREHLRARLTDLDEYDRELRQMLADLLDLHERWREMLRESARERRALIGALHRTVGNAPHRLTREQLNKEVDAWITTARPQEWPT